MKRKMVKLEHPITEMAAEHKYKADRMAEDLGITFLQAHHCLMMECNREGDSPIADYIIACQRANSHR